jgi:ribosome-associated protein
MDAESIRSEIAFRFSRSSGPGGQHAQKSSTRAEALFDVEESEALSAAEKKRRGRTKQLRRSTDD